MAGPVILTMKWAFSNSFSKKMICFLHTIQDLIAGRMVLIKNEFLVTTGKAWPVIFDKWKEPLD